MIMKWQRKQLRRNMPELEIHDISKTIGGTLAGCRQTLKIKDYHFDTRQISGENTLFFALKTEKSDGHQFVATLNQRKNCAAVVSEKFNASGIDFPLLIVPDTLKALHTLTAYVRQKFHQIKYIGVTGSAGKTTTKEFIYQIAEKKWPAIRSVENWNNWIGFPFSLLKILGHEKVGIFELAMSYPGIGEIDLLSEILKPDIAMVLNVFPVHLEFLKNLDNVARGKTEILNYLSSDSLGLVCGDSDELVRHTTEKKGQIIFFGKNKERNHIRLTNFIRQAQQTIIETEFFGIKRQFQTAIINHIHLENIFAAITACTFLGMKHDEIQDALQEIKPVSNRGQIRKHKDFTIIDETYNSNPEALKKTLLWVNQEFPNKKIAVIGDMLELGENETAYHQEIGTLLSNLNFDYVITVGTRAEHIASSLLQAGFSKQCLTVCRQAEEAGRKLKELTEPNITILFKASRGMQLEKAISELLHE
jgi:UDP-N-acetylmuramoyl-tripeptide--D-alanyl-D-alanine ligase